MSKKNTFIKYAGEIPIKCKGLPLKNGCKVLNMRAYESFSVI